MTKERDEFYFQWHFINRCNLRCAHCYQDEYEYKDLQMEDLFKIAQQITATLKKWNMLGRVSLTGGEPFLSPHLIELVNYFEKSQEIKYFNILTNGTCINEKHIDELKKCRKLHQIQISIDGSNAIVHDAVRGNGSFEKTKKTIGLLKENDIEVALMYTLMRQNKEYAVKIIDFAEECGVDAVTVERVTPCGHSSNSDLLAREEVREIYNEITLRANTIKNNLRVRRLRPLWINTSELDLTGNEKIGGFCPIGFTSLAILWDGTVLPCRRLEIPIGNILTDGLYKIWYDSDVLWNIRNKMNLKGKCHGCNKIERCGGCRAIAYETTGDYMGEDVQCWI